MSWFYLHCVVAVIILIADAKGTLEPAVNKFEEKIGIYTPPQDSTKIDTFTIEIDDENRYVYIWSFILMLYDRFIIDVHNLCG